MVDKLERAQEEEGDEVGSVGGLLGNDFGDELTIPFAKASRYACSTQIGRVADHCVEARSFSCQEHFRKRQRPMKALPVESEVRSTRIEPEPGLIPDLLEGARPEIIRRAHIEHLLDTARYRVEQVVGPRFPPAEATATEPRWSARRIVIVVIGLSLTASRGQRGPDDGIGNHCKQRERDSRRRS